MDLKIPFSLALNGGYSEVKLEKKSVNVKFPKGIGIAGNNVLRVKGSGGLYNGYYGDLFLNISIDIPDKRLP